MVAQSAFIDWQALTPESASAALPRLLASSEKAVAAIEAAKPSTYETLVIALDDATRELWQLWGNVSHLLGVMNSEAWRKLQEEWQPKIVAFSLRVGQSAELYAASKRAFAAEKDPTRRRILEKMVEGAERAGVGLEGATKERFNEIKARLAKIGSDFRDAVIDATAAFKYEKDGKTYTIDDAAYPETMKHCADREVRERLCRARAVRAPENAARIDEILRLRAELAKILGYADYAEYSLAAKCAPSVDAVFGMIDRLDAATKAISEREDAELEKEFSTLHLDPSPSPRTSLQPWDRAFCAERLRERTYAYSEDELKKHLELEDVLSGLFRMANFLFGVKVEEMRGEDKPSVWHPDVRFFRVTESGETIAHFYFDPFVRNGLKSGGAWMNEFRNRSRRPGSQAVELPLALVVTNFPQRDADGRCLLPFREVETLFHEFGHALQQMLTRIDDESAAGINLVEWDAVEVASQFMENWCLDDRTGLTIPAELKAKVRAAKNFRAASACRRQLAFAKTDMILHRAGLTKVPDEVKREQFAHFGLPSVEGDIFLCAFGHIFAGGYAAGYYGYKWAEVMSADCYGAFEEAGLKDDAAVKRMGSRYRETILALGGSKSALEVFRDFRGRDPDIAALLRQQGLQ